MTRQSMKSSTPTKAEDVKQTFSFDAPGASSVLLVGDFTHWQKNPIVLRKYSNGTWRVDVALAPGEHRYRFLVDGEWRDDPGCTVRTANPYGSEDSIIRVSGIAQG